MKTWKSILALAIMSLAAVSCSNDNVREKDRNVDRPKNSCNTPEGKCCSQCNGCGK